MVDVNISAEEQVINPLLLSWLLPATCYLRAERTVRSFSTGVDPKYSSRSQDSRTYVMSETEHHPSQLPRCRSSSSLPISHFLILYPFAACGKDLLRLFAAASVQDPNCIFEVTLPRQEFDYLLRH